MSKPLLAAVAAALLGTALPAGAQIESDCVAGQLKAGGALAAAQAKCESKAAAKGEAVDPECLSKAAAKAVKALDKAEGKGDCIVTDPIVQAVVDEFVQDLLDAVDPPPAVCCGVSGACFYTADAAACTSMPFPAGPGAEGSVCRADGTCGPPPATAGNCCQDFVTAGVPIDCAHGAALDAAACAGISGTFSTGICTPAGSCQ
jgi:hypothetical protein